MNRTQSETTEVAPDSVLSDAYQSVFEALPDPALVLDPADGLVIDCNEAAVDLFGYPKAELTDTSVDSLTSGTEAHGRDRAEDVLETVANGQAMTVKREATTQDGRTFWVDVALKPLEIEDHTFVIGSIRDTGESVEEERDVRAFKTAIENAGHSIYWTDVDGTIEYVNPAFEEITGYDRSEVLGRNPRMLKSGEMSEAYYRNLWETITAGETFQTEVVNEDADGEQFVVSQTIAPIEGPTGEIERFVAVNSDITERKRREQRLEAEKTTTERLHQRLSVINRILRHDIRSSVNIIKGNAELAQSSTHELDSAVDTIIDEADRLRRIAESVRHIESAIDDSESETNALDITTLLKTKVLEFRNEYPKATFELSLPEQAVATARERFDLALDHLLSNAVEHNDTASPTVSVTVKDQRDTDTIVIEIADDGPGIPDDEIQPLEEGRETPLNHTSGLGLWLSQWIVSVSGGSLSFAENDPRGTIVRIELETPP